MSHFTVTVCLADDDGRLGRIEHMAGQGAPLRKLIEAHLDHVLAPFDENREVEPYRSYEEGGPEGYWFTQSVRRGAESHRQLQEKGAEALAAERIGKHSFRGELSRNTAMATEAVLEHASGWAGDFALDRELGEAPSWADVARLYNEKYGKDEGDPLLIDDVTGRAYTMSTRNPQSKWDWWVIGGRWPGRFRYRKSCHPAATVLGPEPHWGAPDEKIPPLHCDGGPLRALDLDALRDEAAARARDGHAEYLAVVAGTPEALPWSVFTDNISEASGYDIERAREEYGTQPRIKALHDNRDWAFCDNEDYQMPEALYVERARARAVPGWAVITADGRWTEQGHMGWFGMNDATEGSSIGYWEAANAYIGSLPDNAWLVSVDCHI